MREPSEATRRRAAVTLKRLTAAVGIVESCGPVGAEGGLQDEGGVTRRLGECLK